MFNDVHEREISGDIGVQVQTNRKLIEYKK